LAVTWRNSDRLGAVNSVRGMNGNTIQGKQDTTEV
jgi:hypothetical protein